MQRARRTAVVMGVLALLFLGRVLGQLLVATAAPAFLPPMEQWYSGLIPYPILLPIQLGILALQGGMIAQLWRGAGFFAAPSRRTGLWVCGFSAVYFAAMLLRYLLVMALQPEQRWFGGTIPIFFHWVLAGYLFAYGRYHLAASGSRD